MKTLMAFTMLVLLSAGLARAGDLSSERTFTFDGQNSENILLELVRKETRYRDRTIDTTCERQVQVGEREQCGNETRYRQECRTVPGYNNCYDVNDQDCDVVTRYRQDCRYEPGRRRCHNEPGRQVCRQGPPRQVCTTRRNGARVCATQPGEQICRTEPGRQVCDNEPGRQVCRQVPYTDRICRPVTRRQCDWVPARQDCRQVAYDEWVCRQVPIYETQTYACQRTVKEPYEALAEKVNANIDFEFSGATKGAKASINAKLISGGRLILTAKDNSDTPKLLVASRNLEVDRDGVETSINGTVRVKLQNTGALLAPVKSSATDFYLGQKSLSFKLGKVVDPSDLKLSLRITREGETELSKELKPGQYSLRDVGNKTKVDIDLERQFGLELSRGVFKKHVYEVRITTEVELPSELLNAADLKTSYTSKFSARPSKE